MPAFDLTEFFKLSSVLNYNLSAESLNRYSVLMYILAGKRLDPDEPVDREKKRLVMEALGYLFSAYSHKRRRLGPMAVLHPRRAAALMARAREGANLEILLTVLFHDILEDVQSVDFETQEWRDMEQRLFELLEHMPAEEESRLIQQLKCLTRTGSESYYRYIGRMLECSAAFPAVVEVKLADLLDNTLDMRIDLEDPLVGIDCFQNIFQLLFVNNYPGYAPRNEHQPVSVMNGARRLHQLYKNAVLLSLIRQVIVAPETQARQTLFNAVAEASLKEAQRTLMHVLGYHFKDHHAQVGDELLAGAALARDEHRAARGRDLAHHLEHAREGRAAPDDVRRLAEGLEALLEREVLQPQGLDLERARDELDDLFMRTGLAR